MGRCCCSFEYGWHHARNGQALDWPNAGGQDRPDQSAASCANASSTTAMGKRRIIRFNGPPRFTRMASHPVWAELMHNQLWRMDQRPGVCQPSTFCKAGEPEVFWALQSLHAIESEDDNCHLGGTALLVSVQDHLLR